MVLVCTFVSIYYNVIIAYSIYYMFASFQFPLPWSDCSSWSEMDCNNTVRGLAKLIFINCFSLKCHFTFSEMSNLTKVNSIPLGFNFISRMEPIFVNYLLINGNFLVNRMLSLKKMSGKNVTICYLLKFPQAIAAPVMLNYGQELPLFYKKYSRILMVF